MIQLDHHAQSIIHFLNDHELSLCPQTFKIYLAPHLGREEVSSVGLTLVLGDGKGAVSTPTIFSEETLLNNEGLPCRFCCDPSDGRLCPSRTWLPLVSMECRDECV